MSTMELILTLVSLVGLGAVGWLIKQQFLLGQVLEEVRADRARNDEVVKAVSDLSILCRQLVSLLEELGKDSHAEHMRLIHALEKSDERQEKKHEMMNEKLTRVLAMRDSQ